MLAIKTENLTKKYPRLTAVDSLSLEIEEGEIFSLLGVNGAGKTTTIKMLSCLTEPSSGDAFLLGESIISNPKAVKTFIATSPQETAVAKGLTVRENLDFICGAHGFSREKREARIKEIAEIFSLNEILDKRAGKLSGGWQRRLSIGMALICEPKILFLDEPTLGLDVIARRELWDLILTLKNKLTVILTTHYMEEAEALSDRIAIMKDGRLVACGTKEEILVLGEAESFENAFINIVRGSK